MLATVRAIKLGKVDMSAAHQNFSFDPDKLRAKYRRERDKRIRVDGNDQYIEVTGDFSHYIDDPYVEPGFERDAIQTQVGVLIIGGGFGGMLAAARLRDTGINAVSYTHLTLPTKG